MADSATQFYQPAGVGGYFDDGSANRGGGIAPNVYANGTVCQLSNTEGAGNLVEVSTTSPITWASGDKWWVGFTYEI